jgi:putative SOS response-associated peptidase YedK
MINARGETVDSKPSFRRAFASRRCLIPTDGYYEWKKVAGGKQPYLIEPNDGGILAMAGLWEENCRIAEDGTPIRTCTIITTDANQTTSKVHNRMPVILSLRDHEQWLDPGFRDTETLKALLAPAPEDLLQMTPVSRYVNSPKNDDEQCVAAVDLDSEA